MNEINTFISVNSSLMTPASKRTSLAEDLNAAFQLIYTSNYGLFDSVDKKLSTLKNLISSFVEECYNVEIAVAEISEIYLNTSKVGSELKDKKYDLFKNTNTRDSFSGVWNFFTNFFGTSFTLSEFEVKRMIDSFRQFDKSNMDFLGNRLAMEGLTKNVDTALSFGSACTALGIFSSFFSTVCGIEQAATNENYTSAQKVTHTLSSCGILLDTVSDATMPNTPFNTKARVGTRVVTSCFDGAAQIADIWADEETPTDLKTDGTIAVATTTAVGAGVRVLGVVGGTAITAAIPIPGVNVVTGWAVTELCNFSADVICSEEVVNSVSNGITNVRETATSAFSNVDSVGDALAASGEVALETGKALLDIKFTYEKACIDKVADTFNDAADKVVGFGSKIKNAIF